MPFIWQPPRVWRMIERGKNSQNESGENVINEQRKKLNNNYRIMKNRPTIQMVPFSFSRTYTQNPNKASKKSSQFSPSHSEFICSFSCSHTAIIWILKSATKKKNEFVENWKVKSLFLIVLISCHSVQRYLTRRTLLAQTTNNNEPRKQNAAQETISISFQFDWHLC